jgi:hypothetical protein
VIAIAEDLPRGIPGIQNATIAESHASNAATFALKTAAGNDPSYSDPVFLTFADGTTTVVNAAMSITIPSTGTMGASNATPFRLWFALINDSGTIRMAVRNCSDANGSYGYPSTGITSSTIITTPNSAGVTYTGTAVTSKQFLLLGRSDYESGLTTAGTWAASPTRNATYIPGTAKAGDVCQEKQASSFTLLTNSTAAYVDSSLTASITPSSACNLVQTIWGGNLQVDTAGITGFAALRRAGTIVGRISKNFSSGGNFASDVGGMWLDAPGSSGSITYTVATKLSSASGACYFANADSGAVLELAEIMG